MVSVRYGGGRGARVALDVSDRHVVVRTCDRAPLKGARVFEGTPVSEEARRLLARFDVEVEFPAAGVEVLRATAGPDTALRDEARAVLGAEPEVQFAGRALVTPTAGKPVVYTENFFVRFRNGVSGEECLAVLARHGLEVKRPVEYARNAFFAAAPEGTGMRVFEISEALLADPAVELCHPELVRRAAARAAFPQQWHLKRTTVNGVVVDAHASVEEAWALGDGTGTVIAVIDDGVDVDHEELRGKVVFPRDTTRRVDDARPGERDRHGTACAGVACASGRFGASGVAPGARLMPIRLRSGLGAQAEADAFVWAADHGADVISCSWGPSDGDFTDPSDPLHREVVPLPDSTRLAIDYAATRGRGGKGCVVLFAAGNGNESVDNDGYASYKNVIAVAACNDRGKRAAYSDFGRAVWCSFPSSHGFPSLTPGIWTTDRTGIAGYNPGNGTGQPLAGDAAGNYTSTFGGTSSACPGAAGVAALVLARNPELRREQVRDILKAACDRIDTAGGAYDATGRSRFYGFGRLNAKRAVELTPLPVRPVRVRTARRDVPIQDLRVARLTLPVTDTSALRGLRVAVELDHSFVGDLVVTLKPPAAMGLPPIVLHDREGEGNDSLRRRYDAAAVPALAAAAGKSPRGTWTLEVADQEAQDVGVLRAFTLELET